MLKLSTWQLVFHYPMQPATTTYQIFAMPLSGPSRCLIIKKQCDWCNVNLRIRPSHHTKLIISVSGVQVIDRKTLDLYNQEEAKWGRSPNDPFTGKLFSETSR